MLKYIQDTLSIPNNRYEKHEVALDSVIGRIKAIANISNVTFVHYNEKDDTLLIESRVRLLGVTYMYGHIYRDRDGYFTDIVKYKACERLALLLTLTYPKEILGDVYDNKHLYKAIEAIDDTLMPYTVIGKGNKPVLRHKYTISGANAGNIVTFFDT